MNEETNWKKSFGGILLWVLCLVVVSICAIPFKGPEFALKVFAFLMGLSTIGFMILSIKNMAKM